MFVRVKSPTGAHITVHEDTAKARKYEVLPQADAVDASGAPLPPKYIQNLPKAEAPKGETRGKTDPEKPGPDDKKEN